MNTLTLTALRGFMHRGKIFIHPVRSFRFIRALLSDRRIHFARKALFLVLVAALAALMVFPDLLEQSVLSVILPVVGFVLGIPLGVGLDWAAFALLSVQLLSVFPADVVNEHYNIHILRMEPRETTG